MNVDLSQFDNSFYDPGGSLLRRILWFFVGSPLLRAAIVPSSKFRCALLRAFGAQIAPGAVFKPGVRVKYPWNLKTGRNCWIGEDCWIDNLVPVTLGDNVCLSQAVYLCTGNHDWSDPAFRLVTQSIVIDSQAWIAARASIGPGSQIGEGAIVGFGSVVHGYVPDWQIYAGNPAVFLRARNLTPVTNPDRQQTPSIPKHKATANHHMMNPDMPPGTDRSVPANDTIPNRSQPAVDRVVCPFSKP